MQKQQQQQRKKTLAANIKRKENCIQKIKTKTKYFAQLPQETEQMYNQTNIKQIFKNSTLNNKPAFKFFIQTNKLYLQQN